jgi:hypothetical protein
MTSNHIKIVSGFLLATSCVFFLAKTTTGTDRPAPVDPLPEDPADWACMEEAPTQKEIAQWCAANPDRGRPASLGMPASLLNVDAKNAYDKRLTEFVSNREYISLGWLHDTNWRMTGPYVGEPGSGLSYGTHPAVRMYYSPEIIDWLCSGREEGGIPDGAMLIKHMHEINEELEIELDNEGCMEITAPETAIDESATSWTIMVKDKTASHDGWYWPNPFAASAIYGNPPILDRSAFALEHQVPKNPTERNHDMHPTGNFSITGNANFVASKVYPYNGYGVACLNCHGTANVESTFASLENIMHEGIRYKGFDFHSKTKKRPPASPPFPTPRSEPDPDFLAHFDKMHEVSFADAWELRLPAETYDHVVVNQDTAKTKGVPEFVTSDQCLACHNATISNDGLPNMMYKITEKDESKGIGIQKDTLVDLSMYGEWRVSPMGLAGRDPVFFSQLQSETNHFPELAECIENTCLSCHGALGQRQYSRDTADTPGAGKCDSMFPVPPPAGVPTGQPFPLAMKEQWQNNSGSKHGTYGGLARDGISCQVCHQMEANPVGEYDSPDALSENEPFYTGNFVTTSKPEIFGPLKDDDIVPKPMENVLGLTPKYGEHIKSSLMCGSCHNILLPEITNDGKVLGASYEQSTHLEWANSVYGQVDNKEFKTCQNCHMPHTYNGEKLKFKIANIESSDFAPTTHRLPDDDIRLKERSPYPRHALHGLNLFLNQMFQQFPTTLGLRQIRYMNGNNRPLLLAGQDSILQMARNETANVAIKYLSKNDQRVAVDVLVTNKAGHYFPSGVGFRRAFLEFLVLDKDGNTLWASGRTNKLGMILDGTSDRVLKSESFVENPKAWQPHYEKITNGSQVQVYQEVILDSERNITTSFLRRVHHVKDNRIRPKGFDPAFYKKQSSTYIQALGKLHGVEDDPYYSSPALTGADRIRYEVKLDPSLLAKVDRVKVTLYNQSIPPGYLEERFRDAGKGPKKNNEIQRLYYITSHMNMDTPVDTHGNPILQDWKLKIAGAESDSMH